MNGCKHMPLLTNIYLLDMQVGTLHCADLHVNTVMKEISKCIHWRIDAEEEEIQKLRQETAEAMLVENELFMALEQAMMDLSIVSGTSLSKEPY